MEKVHLDLDDVVIGAGLTGLIYGISMAQSGSKVAILEKHYKPGGYATNFSRKRKHTFDCSLHKITGLGPDGNLRNVLERLEIWSQLNFEFYKDLSTILIEDRSYYLPANYPKIKDMLIQYFPEERDALAQLFYDIENHGYQNYMFARMAIGEYSLNRDLLEGSRKLSKLNALEYFQLLFKNRDLIIIFSSIAINLGVVSHEADALYFLHFAYTFFATGAGYVKKTSQYLSDTLANIFTSAGGILFLAQPAIHISADSNGIQYVETKKHVLNTSRVTATCCPHNIVQMLPESTLSPEFHEKLGRLEFGLGAFSVYVALDMPPELIGFEKSEYIIASTHLNYDSSNSDFEYDYWPLSITNYHLLDSTNGFVLQLIVLDSAKQWFEMSEEVYSLEKSRIQKKIIDRACLSFPQLESHMIYQESSTPRTNHHYTVSPEGSAFGYKPTPGRNVRFLQKEPIPGLNFIGTWINGAGYEPAMCFGFTQAEIKKQEVIKKEEKVVLVR